MSKFKYRVMVFGQLQVVDQAGKVPHFYSDKVRALLVYLLLEGQTPLTRTSLIALLWPRYLRTSALTNLRKALHELKRSLKDTDALIGSRREMWLSREEGDIWCDWWEAESLLDALEAHAHERLDTCTLCQGCIAQLQAQLRKGLCLGLSIDEPDGFDRWKSEVFAGLQARLDGFIAAQSSIRVNQRVGNLPFLEVPLVGRKEEMRHLAGVALDPRVGALVLTGMGGIGKSHLARSLARRVCGDFPDGVWLLSIYAHRQQALPTDGGAEPIGLAVALAALMGLREADGEEAAHEGLKGRRAVIVLDEFEHLLQEPREREKALRELEVLIQSVPESCFIVTSRVSLSLEVGVEVGVRGLAVDDPNPGEGDTSPSVALFEAHRLARLDLDACGQGDQKTILDICRVLEGHPLGVKLAGALSQRLPLRDVLVRLQGDLPSLTSPYRDTPPRHRQLAYLLESAFNGLSTQGKLILAVLVPWEGPARFEDLRSVMASLSLTQARRSDLRALRALSLVESEDDKTYRLHALVRHFTQAQLPRWQEEEGWGGDLSARVAQGVAQHFLRLLSLKGEELIKWRVTGRERLRHSMADFAKSWRYGIQMGMFDELVEALPGFIHLSLDCGQLSLTLELIQPLVTCLKTSERPGSATQLARVQLWLGAALNELGLPLKALEVLQGVDPDSLGALEVSYLRTLLGIQLTLTGQETEGLRLVEGELRDTHPSHWMAHYIRTVGFCHKGMWLARKGLEGAEPAIEAALRISRHHGLLAMELRALLSLGGIKVTSREPEVALGVLKEGASLAKSYGIDILLTQFVQGLAFTYSCLGNQVAALEACDRVEALSRRQGLVHLGGQLRLVRAAALWCLGEVDEALGALEEALSLRVVRSSQPLIESRALAMRALCLADMEHPGTLQAIADAREKAEALHYWPNGCLIDTAEMVWSLSMGDHAGIATGVERLMAWMEAHPGLPSCDCLHTYLVCHRGLVYLGDRREGVFFDSMVSILEQELKQLSSTEARQAFLKGDLSAAEIYRLLKAKGERYVDARMGLT